MHYENAILTNSGLAKLSVIDESSEGAYCHAKPWSMTWLTMTSGSTSEPAMSRKGLQQGFFFRQKSDFYFFRSSEYLRGSRRFFLFPSNK